MTMVTAAMFMVMVGGHRGQGGPWSVVMGSKDMTIGVDVHPKYVTGVGDVHRKNHGRPKKYVTGVVDVHPGNGRPVRFLS